jgi:hypothetical protein
MHIVIGILIALLAVYQIYTGRMVTGGDVGRTSTIRRDDKPVYFWLLLIFELVVAAVLISGIVNF